MTSKTALAKQVRAFDVAGVEASLGAEPDLLPVRDERGRTWLHLCCSVDVTKRSEADRRASVGLASALLGRGLDMNDAAFTEGSWRATPVWFSVARGRNLDLAGFLLGRGADPNHSLFAACFNDDFAAIDLLLSHGAAIDEVAEDETPFLGAIKTSHFASAWRLVERGADVNAVGSEGMTALHYMLKKNSDTEHFIALARFSPRYDVPGPDGVTAAELLARKRDPALRTLANPGA